MPLIKGKADSVSNRNIIGWSSIKQTSTQPYSPVITPVQSDWDVTDTTRIDYIKNKPTIPILPTGTENDALRINSSGNIEPTSNTKIYSTGQIYSTTLEPIATGFSNNIIANQDGDIIKEMRNGGITIIPDLNNSNTTYSYPSELLCKMYGGNKYLIEYTLRVSWYFSEYANTGKVMLHFFNSNGDQFDIGMPDTRVQDVMSHNIETNSYIQGADRLYNLNDPAGIVMPTFNFHDIPVSNWDLEYRGRTTLHCNSYNDFRIGFKKQYARPGDLWLQPGSFVKCTLLNE